MGYCYVPLGRDNITIGLLDLPHPGAERGGLGDSPPPPPDSPDASRNLIISLYIILN